LFADDLVLLSPSESGLQCALNDFAAACGIVEMKISTIKTEVSRNLDQYSLQVSGASVKLVDKFKYLGVVTKLVFMYDGSQ